MGLTYTDEKGEEKIPICIHRAPLSTHERMIGFLIEHFAGAFPTWLAPVQVAIIPVASAHEKYAKELHEKMFGLEIRSQLMAPDETLGKRIREAEKQKIPYMLVVGDKEVEGKSVSVRNYHTKNQDTVKADKFLKEIIEEIKERRLPSK
jgi:threonyl-tRNA synthetase